MITKGMGYFRDRKLPQGIYMIVLPGKKYFEILISDDQKFSVACSYNDYYNTLKFTGSDENSAFIEYQKKWGSMQQKARLFQKGCRPTSRTAILLKILTKSRKNRKKI